MVSFISAFHCCLYLLVYPVLRAGLPAWVLKEQVLNLPLWEGDGTKINSEALNLASGTCQRRYLPSLEALILDTQLAPGYSVMLLCCGIWKITAFQHRGPSWRPSRGSPSSATKWPWHCWVSALTVKIGDANKFLHQYTQSWKSPSFSLEVFYW